MESFLRRGTTPHFFFFSSLSIKQWLRYNRIIYDWYRSWPWYRPRRLEGNLESFSWWLLFHSKKAGTWSHPDTPTHGSSCPPQDSLSAMPPALEHLTQVPCVWAASLKTSWDIWNLSRKLTSSFFLNLLLCLCGIVFHLAPGHESPFWFFPLHSLFTKFCYFHQWNVWNISQIHFQCAISTTTFP